MTDIQLICGTVMAVLLCSWTAWMAWATWQASRNKQSQADSAAQHKADDLVVDVTQRMAAAQAAEPADDAALQARLKAGKL